MKIFRVAGIGLLIAALTWVSVGCGLSTKEVKEVRIGFQTIPNTEAVAKAEGWHEQQMKGVSVKWLPFDSGRDVNNALVSSSIDIGLLGSTLVAAGLSKGVDYKVIWLADVIGANEALAVKNTSNIREMADLKGKTIAVTFGSTTQYSLLGALQLNGLSPNDVHIIDMKPADMLAAWKRGDIDGGYVWQPTLQQMADDGGHILVTSGQLAEQGIVTADVIVVRKAFAQEHPELVKLYLKSMIQAVELYREQPDQAIQATASLFSISEQEAATMMNQLIWLSGTEQLSESYLGTSDHAGQFANVLADTAKFLKDQHLIDTLPSISVFQQAIATKSLKEADQDAGTAQ
ncbi:taurine ABC transporter substrate-binding protein [Paenibacillus guangzhouensis]|uniref:taurine ABC transporter substrate-binding protein n=1 Tax=Paenibacillus guangzhouensis TaxID=1473112 RepID=UPI00187BA3F3|nr:aliphatic sulfonate ABC transporter substrate-binding protein [Paenibacillus guangzhouensis]